jgi:glycosyltransferase A (GT-A) superfamily protein (DUF2064 family)
VLVMAKAPVAGEVKTRLGAVVGRGRAAELAAAALLDTLDVCETVWRDRADRHVALSGDLAAAVAGPEVAARLAAWTVHPQRGAGFAQRLVAAHADVSAASGIPVVQIGMDTPHVSATELADVAARIGSGGAVLGPAADGGWWVLAVGHGGLAAPLAGVQMSAPTTYDDTRGALEAAGTRVAGAVMLRDVDTVADAEAAARVAPGSRFARAWAATGVLR